MITPLTWIEFFARVIPESFFVLLAVYAFSRQELDIKTYILSSLLFADSVFFVRNTFSYGIHTIISLILLIAIVTYICKIKVTISIRSAMLTQILLFICEGFNFLVIQYLLHLDISKMFEDVKIKIIYGFPSLALLIIISIISYFVLVNNKKVKNV